MSHAASSRLFVAALCAVLLVPSLASAQVFVYPRRPDKSQVRHFDFDWRHIDILVGPEADTADAEVPPPEEAEAEGTVTPGTSEPAPPDATEPDEPEAPESAAPATPDPPPATPAPDPRAEPAPTEAAETVAPATPAPDPRADAPLLLSTETPAPTPEPSETPVTPTPTTETAPDTGGPSTTITESDRLTGATRGLEPGPPGRAPEPAADKPKKRKKKSPWARKLGPEAGGVRLYFYERERHIAERAAGFIQDSYRYLVKEFDYVPARTFPYILYSSYQEFLQTNLFPLQEGVLGVTSPRDLKLTLPYFGDHRLFEEVGTHEMVHQFTIQKVRSVAEAADLWGDPLEGLPLWFIEGMAEYYAKRGIDPEAEMLVRDIVVNPDYLQGYVMLDFFEDRPFSVLWTYKVGQVRCVFLEETYGKGVLQKVLEGSPRLIGAVNNERQLKGFRELLTLVTGDEPRTLSAKFEDWLKRRAYRTYLGAAQNASLLRPLEEVEGRVGALDASEDGDLLLYRTIDLDTAQSRLVLVDRRAPQSRVRVASDGVPGVESLHPVAARNFDVRSDRLTFVAESKGRDVIYVQDIRHKAKKRDLSQAPEEGRGSSSMPRGPWEVTLKLGKRTTYRLADHGLLAAEAPVFGPEGRRIAFIGLDDDGEKDVFLLTPSKSGDGPAVIERLTDDVWAERELAWGPDGIVFTSDGTVKGHYNLFRIDPDGKREVERLTNEERDHFDPLVLDDGRTFFVAYDHARADVYEVAAGEVRRRTDLDTGLFDLAPGPEGGLWGLWHNRGQRLPTLLPKEGILETEPEPVAEAAPARTLPHHPLPGASPYRPLSPRNWELGNLFGYFGAGGSGVFGQLLASGSDRLRNHAVILNLFVFGSLDLTDGFLVYINQEDRVTWGGGLFQSLVFRTDQTPELAGLTTRFTTAERFYGALGSLRYPFNTYQYIQGDLALGGASYFLTADAQRVLGDGDLNGSGRNLIPLWNEANRGARLQTEAKVRLGYDTIRYHRATGPLAGSSLMVENTTTVQPLDDQVFGNLRLDGERYFSLWGRANVFFRFGAGTTYGGRFARQFYLSSFDTLRGVPFGDADFLRGRHFFFSTAELQFPLNAIIRLILFTDIEALVGVDFGGVGDDLMTIWDKRVLDFVVGVNFGFGPLVFRLHFAKPVDTGADPSRAGVARGLPANGRWVTNFSLGWIYF